MEYQDYYKTMDVARDATATEIKRAYRKLARKYHPDVSKESDAEARFKTVGEAYAVLKDPEKRAAYDQLGSNWEAGQDFTAPPGWDAGFEFHGSNVNDGTRFASSDFFDALFGQGFRGQGNASSAGRANRGQDHHAKVMIDLEDAWLGSKQKFTLRVPESMLQATSSRDNALSMFAFLKVSNRGSIFDLPVSAHPVRPRGSQEICILKWNSSRIHCIERMGMIFI